MKHPNQQISLIINGRQYQLIVDDHKMLSYTIPEKAGFTATKAGCEQGSCGAYTLMMNDKAILRFITMP
jgi:xanthine dehydrogenase YagT iron-sulfur-binding subunit